MAAPPDDLGLRLVACPARHLPPVPRRDSQMIFAPPGPLYCSAEAPTTTWTASCRSIDRGPRPPARRRARMVGTTYADRWETQADLGVQVETTRNCPMCGTIWHWPPGVQRERLRDPKRRFG